MGTEIVFVLIYPVALICVVAAIWFWFGVSKLGQPTGIRHIMAYLPLIAGLAVSMAGLALLTYVETNANFTSLIQQGYYTESERPVYLPRRVVGQALVNLVFVLPLICFVVVPLTTRLIRTGRLGLGEIGLRTVIGWIALSFVGWILVPAYSLPDFLRSTAVPILIYGLPIPIAALLFFPRKGEGMKPR